MPQGGNQLLFLTSDQRHFLLSFYITFFIYSPRIASFISFTNAATCGTQSFPYFSHNFTIAEPTITPSDCAAIFFACSAPEIPNPTAHGMSFCFFTNSTIAPISVVISERTLITSQSGHSDIWINARTAESDVPCTDHSRR